MDQSLFAVLNDAVAADATRLSGRRFADARGAGIARRVRTRRTVRAVGAGGASAVAVGGIALGATHLPWGGTASPGLGATDCVTPTPTADTYTYWVVVSQGETPVETVSLTDAATEHLMALGHRAIAHIGGDPLLDLDFHLPHRRRAGYEEALTARGVTPDPRLVRVADFTIEGGYRATLQLLGDPRVSPTAIFAASDEMAMGAIMAAKDLGRKVPEELSIVGIDGHELGDFFGLTTVSQFPETQGRLAAEAVLRALHGDAIEPTNAPLPYELVVRRSTSAPGVR